MLKGLIGQKIGMTRLFLKAGKVVPVTILQVGPCQVVQIKTFVKEQYVAVQLGWGDKKSCRVNKPLLGHFKKVEVEPFKVLKEFKVGAVETFGLGQEFKADLFLVGDNVKVTGTSKGRGFTGVVKRYNFSGGRDTHGCTTHDSPGSIGASADPSRVMKGRSMPGQYGNQRCQVINLKVVDVKVDKSLIIVKGAVPGPNGGIVIVEKV